MVSSHPVVSDKEWVQARIAFMDLEREHKAATRVLAEKRRLLPWRKIKDDYIFDGGPLGKRSLVELFGKADTLFVYHLILFITGIL